jgi:hypothetical protein
VSVPFGPIQGEESRSVHYTWCKKRTTVAFHEQQRIIRRVLAIERLIAPSTALQARTDVHNRACRALRRPNPDRVPSVLLCIRWIPLSVGG